MPALSSTNYLDDRTRRDPPRKKLRPADVITRAAVCELLRAQVRPGEIEDPAAVVDRVYDRCPATRAYLDLERAAVNPASTSVAGWAQELVQSSIADFLAGPQGASAFAQLANQAMSITLPAGTGVMKIPSLAATLVGGWVGESSAKPVTTIPLTTVDLVPFKIAVLSTFSEELLMHSTPSIETVVTDKLRRDLNARLDASLLDSTAASSIRPAGLFAGVTPITASTTTPTSEAMAADLKGLVATVSTGAPDAKPVYIAHATQHKRMVAAGYEAILSNRLAANSVACVDASAIAMTATPPIFQQSRDAAYHAEDTTPLALGTGVQGSGVLAVPMVSGFQMDIIAIRSRLSAGWVRRRSGCTAIVTGATW